MNECPACSGTEGATHTCPGSGTYVAAEAHGLDQVEIAEESAWPRFQVTVNLRMRAPDELTARQRLTGFVSGLLSDDLVEDSDLTIMEWEAGA
jgi:hypothetical protein